MKTKIIRVPDYIERDLRDIMRIRESKGLIKNPQIPVNKGTAEALGLAWRSPYMKNVLDDLKTKPKKENLPQGGIRF